MLEATQLWFLCLEEKGEWFLWVTNPLWSSAPCCPSASSCTQGNAGAFWFPLVPWVDLLSLNPFSPLKAGGV